MNFSDAILFAAIITSLGVCVEEVDMLMFFSQLNLIQKVSSWLYLICILNLIWLV